MEEIQTRRSIAAGAIIAIAFFAYAGIAHAGPIEDLQANLEAKKAEIKKLEEEAEQFKKEIIEKQQEGKSLSAELTRINNAVKKLRQDIALNERTIDKTELEINLLEIDIRGKVTSIQKLKNGLAGSMQALAESDQESPLELFLKYTKLSEFFRQLDYFTFLREKMLSSLDTLRILKKELETKTAAAQEKKEELETLQGDLTSRKKIQEGVQQERNELLQTTKNEEKRYQALLKEREAQRKALEDEVFDIEEKLRIAIDPSSLPPKRPGFLGPPMPDFSPLSCWNGGGTFKNCITQFFGYTAFAKAGAYGQKGHNGADVRATIGMPVLATDDGVIEATGDTDLGCRGASYGKWVLIRHASNISTLYAHLSGFSVSAGQSVQRGQTIGFSGRSGYATGPHLHLSVLVTKATEVQTIKSKTCGRNMTLPVAGHDPVSGIDGYLNPLDYL